MVSNKLIKTAQHNFLLAFNKSQPSNITYDQINASIKPVTVGS